MIRAVILKDILWPQKQEDREEGGWKAHPNEAKVCDTRVCDDASTQSQVPEQATMSGAEKVEQDAEPVMEGDVTAMPRDIPAITERLIEESVRGRTPRQNDSMV